MINTSTITKAAEAILKRDLDSRYTVERSGYVNMDEDVCPWIGVYKGPNDIDPVTLGRSPGSWKSAFELRLLIQESSGKSAQHADEKLEKSVQEVLDVIMNNRTLGGTIAKINSIRVDYSFNETESESLYFQNAEIVISTEVRTQ